MNKNDQQKNKSCFIKSQQLNNFGHVIFVQRAEHKWLLLPKILATNFGTKQPRVVCYKLNQTSKANWA